MSSRLMVILESAGDEGLLRGEACTPSAHPGFRSPWREEILAGPGPKMPQPGWDFSRQGRSSAGNASDRGRAGLGFYAKEGKKTGEPSQAGGAWALHLTKQGLMFVCESSCHSFY